MTAIENGEKNGEKTIRIICPYCKVSFKQQVEHQKAAGLHTTLINNHPNGKDCPPFLIFIDANGKHRGSQKIDSIEHGYNINEQLLENARSQINELNEAIRFYHIKVPRGRGRGFENKVSNVTDRAIMSSRFYTILIDSLSDMQAENLFGAITLERDGNFEGGLLVYGKYFGMIYTLFWKDQKVIQNQNMDELQANANLIIEQLLDIYDLTDFFF